MFHEVGICLGTEQTETILMEILHKDDIYLNVGSGFFVSHRLNLIDFTK